MTPPKPTPTPSEQAKSKRRAFLKHGAYASKKAASVPVAAAKPFNLKRAVRREGPNMDPRKSEPAFLPNPEAGRPPPPRGPWYIETKEDGTTRVIANLHPGQSAAMRSPARFTLMLAGSQSGKALAIDTPIATPGGWTTMGMLNVGDLVFDLEGMPTKVTYVSPIYLGNRCFRIIFDDGTSVVADAEHQWVTQTSNQRKNQVRRMPPNPSWNARPQCAPTPDELVVTTEQIAATLISKRGAANHSLPFAAGPRMPDAELPIPPYTLGVWLGDGHSSGATITSADEAVLGHIADEGIAVGAAKDWNAGAARCYRIGGGAPRVRNAAGQWSGDGSTMQEKLRASNLIENKHIPEQYLFSSLPQRLALLQGLMDSDGSISFKGAGATCEYTTVLPRLATDVATLARSLGLKVRMYQKVPTINGRPCRLAHRLTFTTTQPVFRLQRKAARLRQVQRPDTTRRYIVAADPVPSVAVRCITVASATSQFLCTTAYIPTHNTSVGPLWLEREIRLRGPGDYMAVTPTYTLLKAKMLPEFLRLFKETLNLGTWSKGDKTFTYWDGQTRIMFGSATNPESLESATGKGAWLDECGQIQFRLESWEAVQRRLSMNMGRTFMTTTPYATNWLKSQVYDRAIAGDPDYRVVQFASTLNPSFPKEEMARVERTQAGWKVRMFYKGLFDRPPNAIYSEYIDDYRENGGHLVKPFPGGIPHWWPRYMGMDFGGSNQARVYLARDPISGVLYAYDEELAGDLTIKSHVAQIWSKLGGAVLVGVWGGSKSEEAWRVEFTAHGLIIQPPPVWDVELGIDAVTALLKERKLMVVDTCKGLRDEFGTYSRKMLADGLVLSDIRDKSRYHRCFVAGTMVDTMDGDKPIEQVRPGDMVKTRHGYRSVVDATLTARHADVITVDFADGRSLTGTPNHPVWVDGAGWTALDALRYGTMVLCDRRRARSSCTEDSYTDAIQKPRIGRIESTFTLIRRRWARRRRYCTSPFGLPLMAPCRAVRTFITRTTTPSTTTQIISRRCRQPNIRHIISPVSALRCNVNIWHPYVTWRLHGTAPTLGYAGTLRMGSAPGTQHPRSNVLAISARPDTKLATDEDTSDSAPIDVSPLGGGLRAWMTRFGRVRGAARALQAIDTRKSKCARLDVVAVLRLRPALPTDVYNLTVDTEHEYFANGILVSNCDALRYVALGIQGAPNILPVISYGSARGW